MLTVQAGLVTLGAQAQQVSETLSPAARCLTVEPGAPEEPAYPVFQLKNGTPGAAQVLLVFSAPDAAPSVEVQEHTDSAFADAVREHARHLRVPCMGRGEAPVRLLRDYVFRPDDRKVQWFSARDATGAADLQLLKCRTHAKGQEWPDYPRLSREEGHQGRVLAELRFDAADRPPHVVLHGRRSTRTLRQAVGEWAAGLRLPCHPGSPVRGEFLFAFILEGQGNYGFKEVGFRQFLGSVAGIERQRLNFDTRDMGCPFDIRLTYLQPNLRNRVGEVGERNPARRPLLEWLETVSLKLPADSLDAVYGDNAHITVPCVLIDHKPKE